MRSALAAATREHAPASSSDMARYAIASSALRVPDAGVSRRRRELPHGVGEADAACSTCADGAQTMAPSLRARARTRAASLTAPLKPRGARAADWPAGPSTSRRPFCAIVGRRAAVGVASFCGAVRLVGGARR